jgi:hypothetical protein
MKLSLGLSPRDYSVAGGAVVYDADAQAYFTANTAITSDADKNAINTFYLGLKSDSIYTKIKAMYLPLWSSATANKWNLVNPVDTNAGYRLTFSTGWTHSSSGMTPNGTSAFADSFITTSITGLNSGHLSYYSRTNSTGAYVEMGALQNSPNSYTDLAANLSGVGAFIRYNNGGSPTGITNTNSTGFYINTRTASNSLKFFKNGSLFQSLTTVSNSTSATRSIYIGALNNQGNAINFSNRQCSFASIGTGLTDTESTNFSNRVNTLMTYFGINTF